MGRGIVGALVLAAALTGCGDASSEPAVDTTPAVPAASPTAMLPADGPVRARATVLDEGEGPMLCLGSIAFSYPPQCSGPDVDGWVWDDHPHEASSGVRWGSYTMSGSWDGTTFTPAVVRETTPDDHPEDDVEARFATRCPEPAGGWAPVDPVTTTREALSAAHRVAEELPDHAVSWGDQSINPVYPETLQDDPPSLEVQQAMNDPRWTILNVGVTEDVARAEAAVREVWGGALCVSEFAHTRARLREVAEQVRNLPGGLDSSYGSISNTVEIGVVHDDGSIQGWADEEFGPGVVTVTSALVPIP